MSHDHKRPERWFMQIRQMDGREKYSDVILVEEWTIYIIDNIAIKYGEYTLWRTMSEMRDWSTLLGILHGDKPNVSVPKRRRSCTNERWDLREKISRQVKLIFPVKWSTLFVLYAMPPGIPHHCSTYSSLFNEMTAWPLTYLVGKDFDCRSMKIRLRILN